MSLHGDRGGIRWPERRVEDDLPLIRLPPGYVAGRYRVVRRIGRGGMADVYHAVHIHLGHSVALKVARADDDRLASCERLKVEAQVLWDLRHPSVAALRDIGVLPGGTPWFAMELVEGETLASRLERGPIDVGFGCELLAEIAGVLRLAHQRGVVHRDLKPENIILQRGGEARCKLIDWGIARVKASAQRHTEIGLIAGTPGYMAPEQARGEEVDWRSDVYALACCAFEMFTGKPPFEGHNALDVLLRHVNETPPTMRQRCPEVPAPLDRLVDAMLAKDPEDRPRLAEIAESAAAIAAAAHDAELELAIVDALGPVAVAPIAAATPADSDAADDAGGPFEPARDDDPLGSPDELELCYAVA